MRKKKNDNVAVLLIALIIAASLGFAFAFVLLRGGSDKDTTSDSPQTETANSTNDTNSGDQTGTDTNDDTATSPVDTTQADSTAEQSEDSEEAAEDTTTEDEEDEEPKEIVTPTTVAEVNSYMPEGTSLTYFWYSKMNDDEYDEVIVSYVENGQAKLLALGVKDDEYQILWEEEVPGESIIDPYLTASDRNGDGTYEIAVWTGQGASSGFTNLYQYSDEGLTNIIFSGGPHDGENAEVSWWGSVGALDTSQVYRVDLGDSDGDGQDEIQFFSGPAEGDINSGDYLIYKDTYEWDGTSYSYVGQEQVNQTE